MGRRRRALLAAPLLAITLGTPVAIGAERSFDPPGSGSGTPWIVVFGSGRRVDRSRDTLAEARSRRIAREATRAIRALDIQPTQRYRAALEGFSANLTPRQLDRLRRNPAVRTIMPDYQIQLDQGQFRRLNRSATPVDPAALSNRQVVPSGVRRVNANRSSTARIDGRDHRIDVDVAILDTGIDAHADLNIAGGYDCMSRFRGAWRDRYGHGTHVAGTIGAIDDDQGVVGVAPGARVWAVKALDDHGRGFASWYLCGVDWVMKQRDPADPSRPLIEVVNMSVSALLPRGDDQACGTKTGDALHQAICASVADGTVYVVAAGNQSQNAAGRLPAAYDEVITVSALADYDGRPGGRGRQSAVCPGFAPDSDDTYANFSNYGSDVDIIAPGKCILSTYRRGSWIRFSGTSMATPTVAGAVALYLAEHPEARPGQVKSGLRYGGSNRWRQSSDPDGIRDPLLDVLGFRKPPTFVVRHPDGPFRLGPGGRLDIPLRVVRLRGHRGEITLDAIDAPAGVNASIRPGSDGRPVLVLRADDSITPGDAIVRVRGRDAEIARSDRVPITMVGGRLIDFDAPAEDTLTVVPAGTAVEVAWREPGGPPDGRSLQHQWARPGTAGSCSGIPWENDGPAVTPDGPPWSFTEHPDRDGCHRWMVSVEANGDTLTWVSGPVMVDGLRPRGPDVRASGDGVFQRRRNGTVWVRAGTGVLTLEATGRDASGGVVRTTFGPLSQPPGWSYTPGTVEGDPASIDLAWDPAAEATTLQATSVDVLGNVGAPRQVDLRIDRRPPGPVVWRSPSGSYVSAGQPILDWSTGNDRDSGFAALQLVQRQRARPRRAGSCSGASFRPDGKARLLPRDHQETDLRSGWCYRWRLTSLDSVGNRGPARTSGSILYDATPPRANFVRPDEGTSVEQTSRTVRLRWSMSDPGGATGLSALLERERVRIGPGGGCSGRLWRMDGSTRRVRSSYRERRLDAGYCYRWRLILEDGADNMGTWISGVRRIVPRAVAARNRERSSRRSG
jgi:subtilisin family serine protease